MSAELGQAAPARPWGQMVFRAIIVAYLILLAANFVPVALRPAWLGEAGSKALLHGLVAAYFLAALMFGSLSSLRPSEKAAFGLVFGLAGLGSVFAMLELIGFPAPAGLAGTINLLAIAAVVGFIYVRFVRRRLSRPRRADPAMDAD